MRLTPTSAESRAEVATALPLILRVGVALCFLGHGAFGLITKKAWLDYFAVAGISEAWGWKLMPWIGGLDILVAALALLWPCRALFFWAFVWATLTALTRPLAHQGWSEFLERAGNYGVPLAILVATGVRGSLFARLAGPWKNLTEDVLERLVLILRLALATLLAGHAACALLLKKPALAHHYEIFSVANSTVTMLGVGWFELGLAVTILLIRSPFLFLFACSWKLATELLFVASGAQASAFEVIERGGSYIIPLALAYLLSRTPTPEQSVNAQPA